LGTGSVRLIVSSLRAPTPRARANDATIAGQPVAPVADNHEMKLPVLAMIEWAGWGSITNDRLMAGLRMSW
jgi:hypothetical protein